MNEQLSSHPDTFSMVASQRFTGVRCQYDRLNLHVGTSLPICPAHSGKSSRSYQQETNTSKTLRRHHDKVSGVEVHSRSFYYLLFSSRFWHPSFLGYTFS